MKIRVHLKDPDGFSDSINEAIRAELKKTDGIDVAERKKLLKRQRRDVRASLERWVEYGEYVTVEFDIEVGTAVVVERK